jgi:uncharacterized protein
MKFQPDSLPGVNLVSRHEAGRIWVGATAYDHSVLVPSRGAVQAWEVASFGGLAPAHFERVAASRPEVVIFGSGMRLRFPPAPLLRPLIQAGIGIETMDTSAACRTYNVLASEGRSVLAALLLADPGDP